MHGRGSAIGRLPELGSTGFRLAVSPPSWDRRALVAARLADATERGATTVVSAPVPHGWRLRQALKFRDVPVVPAPAPTYQSDGLGSSAP